MQKITAIREWLKGKKTYIVLGLAAVVWFCQAAGILQAGIADQIIEILLALGGVTLAAKINRLKS